MRYLLSRASRPVLTRLAGERTLCAFDFDGTLAPIVERPEQAGMRARTRRLLARLAAAYPCIIVSGRARADVLGKLGGVEVAQVIGNHGAEPGGTQAKARRQIERWKEALEVEIGTFPGVWVEDKGFSLAVHYRQCHRKAAARRRILEVSRKLEQASVFGGKKVINLAVQGAPRKGDALASERDRLRCRWVLFVGDAEDDEDAFALKGNTIAVRVGRKRQSHASYFLRSQAEIDKLLEVLVSRRQAV
ncbi:MAG: trehalose-phosphatase [Bryobacteraceae bacterium]|jgi:trehalose 6-phosphate phosphatase